MKETAFISPEGILMLTTAILLDVFGLICLVLAPVFGIGEILSFIPDFMGYVIFGSWMFMRGHIGGGNPGPEIKPAAKGLGGKISKRLLRFAFGSIGETIPVIGGLPCWTIMVILELKS